MIRPMAVAATVVVAMIAMAIIITIAVAFAQMIKNADAADDDNVPIGTVEVSELNGQRS